MSDKGFLRLNHFHGLRLETEDFQVGERYHIEKMKLHNRAFHSPGVVPNHLGELQVSGRRRGDTSIEVAPGYAIDGEGHDIFLWETEVKVIETDKMKLPSTAYVLIKSVEEPTEFVVNKANPRFQGHKRILETSRVEVVTTEPEGTEEGVEIARIRLDENTTEIRDAADPEDPQVGEIDRRYVPRAGQCGSYMDRGAFVDLRETLGSARGLLGRMARQLDLGSARDARQAVITLEMLVRSNLVNLVRDAVDGLEVVGQLQEECVDEVRKRYPDLAEQPDFLNFAESVQGLVQLLEASDGDVEGFRDALRSQGKALDSLDAVIEEAPEEAVRPEAPEPEEEPEEEEQPEGPAEGAAALSWDEFQELGEDFPPDLVYLDGQNYALVDAIDFGNPKSRKDHDFEIADADDQSRARRNLMYPDGTKLEASGVYHKGGYSEWTIENLEPGRDLIVAKRIDFSRGDLVAEIQVDGETVGNWDIEGSDTRHPWRNWLFKVPGSFIEDGSIKMKQVAQVAERDINMFGLWFFQATD